MKPGLALGLIVLAAAVGVGLRVVDLEQRPMHTDESVHAIKFIGLWERGVYRYDPHEYHGPLLYYATLPLVWGSGAGDAASLTERALRLAPAVFGVGLILLVWLVRGAMGEAAAVWAAGWTAVSPALVFYSRYFIHEMLLVVLAFVFLGAVWRYLQAPRMGWMLLAGLGLGGMYATKETFVFVLAAAAAGAAGAAAWGRWREGRWMAIRLRWQHLVAGLLVAGWVGVILFTSFFTNPAGPLDSLRTYLPWLARAEGASPHVHPWHYYLGLMLWTRRGGGPIWTEALVVVLGLWGAVVGLRARQLPWGSVGWVRFLTFYTVLLTVVYSAIPYKTPWCEIGFLHGWVLLAGTGVAALLWRLQGLVKPVLVCGGLVLGMGHLGWQAWRAAVPLSDSQRNPFVYAHTLSTVRELVERVEAIAAAGPAGRRTVIKVMAKGGDYWPLPWYYRGFERVGWYATVPEHSDEAMAPIIVASPDYAPVLGARLGERVEALGYFGLRPGVFLQLHVESELWARYLRGQER